MNGLFKRHQKVVIWLLVIGFLASIVVAGGIRLFTSPASGSAEETVLVVDGRKVTRQEFAQAYGNLLDYYKQLYALYGLDFESLLQGTEGAFRSLPYMAQAAEEIVRSAVLAQAGRELRVTVSKAEVDRAVAERYQALLTQYGFTERDLAEYLKYQGLTLDAYKKELAQSEEARLREERVRQLVVGPVEPTEADLLAYYEANQDRYQTQSEMIRVGHILVAEARLADGLLTEVAAPDADFAALAQAHSLDEETKGRGGETDWFSRDESPFSVKVTDAVWPLEVGEVRLVEDDEGFHIVKLLERRPATVPEFAAVRDTVKSDYVREEEAKRWDSWYAARRERTEVKATDPVLAAAMAYGSDRSAALAELEAARSAGTSTDPYLSYYVGRLHEELLAAAASQRVALEGKEERTPEEEAELSRLRAAEARHRADALAAYRAFLESGTVDDAFFDRMLALAPEDPDAHFARAEMYRQAGKWLQAEAEYRQAIEGRPEFVAAHIGHGDVLMALELHSAAAEAYRKALDLQPGNVTVSLKLASAYVKGDQFSLGRPLLDEVLARDPNNATALLLLGDLLLAEGDAQGAIARYDAAYKRGLTADALLKLAGAYLAAGQVEEAKKRYEDAIRVFPYRSEGHLGLGDVYVKLGDPDKALASYRQALSRAVAVSLKETIARKIVSLDPTDLRTRYLLASYYRDQYKYDGAIPQYEAILDLSPGNLDALVGLGDCYLAKVQYDRALDYYRQALDVAATPQEKLPIYTQMVAVEEGRAGVGAPLGPAGLEFLWQRAQLYAQLGQRQEAVDDLERIASVDPTFRSDEVAGLLAELTLPEPR
ncbi:tetratricopeptide repeat protein [Candidatus Bipolaricaulota bacterium]|nr:tetratricopeptide repeat protein [Candidatus Bipolaricaulota bacterium]